MEGSGHRGAVWTRVRGALKGPEPGLCAPDRAVIFPVAPGFHISPDERLPFNECCDHVVHGIESPETYILGPCAAAIWRSGDVLGELCDGLPEPMHYRGWSFGGGMGALMLPWEPRFHSAELGQVTFVHQPFRVRIPTVFAAACFDPAVPPL